MQSSQGRVQTGVTSMQHHNHPPLQLGIGRAAAGTQWAGLGSTLQKHWLSSGCPEESKETNQRPGKREPKSQEWEGQGSACCSWGGEGEDGMITALNRASLSLYIYNTSGVNMHFWTCMHTFQRTER